MNKPITILGVLGGLLVLSNAAAQDEVIVIGREGNRCAEDTACFNRIHPDIPMAAEAAPGQTIVFRTRNAGDYHVDPASAYADPRGALPYRNAVHPLTGPVYIEGAGRGDVLAITILDIDPANYGYTSIVPIGFVNDIIAGPGDAVWSLNRREAVSDDIPGVRIPNASFPGIVTTLPGTDEHAAMLAREAELFAAGGAVNPPNPEFAVPASLCGPEGSARDTCLRTPPRASTAATWIFVIWVWA